MKGVLGGILALILLSLGAFSLYRWSEMEALARDGARSTGVITRLERRVERRGESFYLHYAFPVPHGKMAGAVSVDAATFERVATGAPVEVRFDPRDPGPRHVVLPYGLDDVRGLMQYAIVFGFAVAIAAWSWRAHRRERARQGAKAAAPP